MRKSPYRKNAGGMWAAGLGLLGLLVTITIMVILFSQETSALFKPGTGTIRAKEQAEKLMGTINERNAGVDQTIAQQAGTAPAPSPSPSPAVTPSPSPAASAAPSPSPVAAPRSGGGPTGGEVLGPPSPISPIAPIQEGPGPNLRGATRPAGGLNDLMKERNKELEDAVNGK